MTIVFSEDAWKDYLFWQKTDKKTLQRTNDLIKDCLRHPFQGIGKPESLKFDMSGYWSRRINAEHRLVYKSENDQLVIIQCCYHY